LREDGEAREEEEKIETGRQDEAERKEIKKEEIEKVWEK